MSERYRLVFRGEVLEGQHKAVVKQRLGAALKVEGERLDAMFTGKAVTIRKDADTDTAARFQIVFKRAGARLRVVPVVAEEAESETAPTPPVPADNGVFRLAPRGSLMADPRPDAATPTLDIAYLTLAAPGTVLGVPNAVVAVAPDVSHMTIAAPGTDLGVPSPAAPAPPLAPAWGVADAGVDLAPYATPVEPPFDLDLIDFELAPAGTLLVDADHEPVPQPPDTSHLSLQ